MDAKLQLRIVRFWAGGHEFAIEANEVAAMRPADEDAPYVETLLDLDHKPQPGTLSRVLVIRSANGSAPHLVNIGEPIRLDWLEGGAIHPLPPLLTGRNVFPRLRALVLTPDSILPLITLI